MAIEPGRKRVAAFFDGQNLFHAAKKHFGYTYPNCDPHALAETICAQKGWHLEHVYFYTGIHDASENPKLHQLWTAKLAVMGSRPNTTIFTRLLRYAKDPASGFTAAREKGIDVRIAIDVIRKAIDRSYDVALIFSGDQDLSEAADEVRCISVQQNRWIKVASAVPSSDKGSRGINNTDWIRFDRACYDACLDLNDYRPRRTTESEPVA